LILENVGSSKIIIRNNSAATRTTRFIAADQQSAGSLRILLRCDPVR
jgi:hypothetical protein